MENQRYQRGLEKLSELDGETGLGIVEKLEKISPDFAKYLVEFPFGDIFSRPGLDLRSREIAVLGSLIALGHALPQLKVHVNAALNIGITKNEIVEIIIQSAVYAGFPAALNAFSAAHEVFTERGLV